MFRTTFTNNVTTLIPSDVDHQTIIKLLHDHDFLITMSPIVTRHSPRDKDPATDKITYDVWENIDLLPFGWWKHELHFTASFQNKDNGVVSWIEAPLGFNSKADYSIRGAKAEDDLKAAEGSDSSGMVLEENIESSCNLVFKPFVEMTMVPVRKKMHAQIVEKAREEGGAGAGAGQ